MTIVDGPLRVALLGFTVTDDDIDTLLAAGNAMPTQTHLFAWSLVEALAAGGCEVRLLSAVPAANYPRDPRLSFRGGPFETRGVGGQRLGFVNLLGAKHATRFGSAVRVGLTALRRWRSQVLLIHGVHSPFLWFGVLARRRLGITVVPVLTDPPGVIRPQDSRLANTLRRLDIGIVKHALARCDAVVALTQALADDFAPGRPCIVMEGILGKPPEIHSGSSGRDTFVVGYAGGLTRDYGVRHLVEAVRGMDDPDVRLRIFGRGELTDWIASQADLDPRIAPPRFLRPTELTAELAVTDVLVNPRPLDAGFVKYSFPSKLIEYLSLGVPVVTTRLPGMPAEYDGRVVYADDTVAGLRAAIAQVRAMPVEQARALGVAGADFVRETRSAGPQGTRLTAFLTTLAHH